MVLKQLEIHSHQEQNTKNPDLRLTFYIKFFSEWTMDSNIKFLWEGKSSGLNGKQKVLRLGNNTKTYKHQKWRRNDWLSGVNDRWYRDRRKSSVAIKFQQERSFEWNCSVSVVLPTSWLWYFTIVLQGVTMGENKKKGTWYLCITAYKCMSIYYLKIKSLINNKLTILPHVICRWGKKFHWISIYCPVLNTASEV